MDTKLSLTDSLLIPRHTFETKLKMLSRACKCSSILTPVTVVSKCHPFNPKSISLDI